MNHIAEKHVTDMLGDIPSMPPEVCTSMMAAVTISLSIWESYATIMGQCDPSNYKKAALIRNLGALQSRIREGKTMSVGWRVTIGSRESGWGRSLFITDERARAFVLKQVEEILGRISPPRTTAS